MSAEDLRARRKAVGLSQQELARLAGCSIAMVGLLDRGYRPDSGEVLGRVIEVIEARELKAAA